MFGNLGGSGSGAGMIGLEQSSSQQTPHHRQQQPSQPTTTSTTATQMIGFSTGYNNTTPTDQPPQTHLSMKQNYHTQPNHNHHQHPFATPHHQPKPAASDDDEHGSANDGSCDPFDGKGKGSPWQRMKWTDTMVKLLIMAVYYIGDEACGVTSSEPQPVVDKKSKSGCGSGSAAAAQKKGKWKSVSWAMMEKGYSVSPQQCEDKFNDLNKRYKRVNDILGKGTACKVVENQGLLDGMDLLPRMKEEVRKLLNSKHLYFREMCAYHNSCGHGGGGSHQSPESVEEKQQQQQHPHPPQPSQQKCYSHPMMSPPSTNQLGNFGEESRFVKGSENLNEDDEDEDDEEDDEEVYEHHEDDHHHGHVSGQDWSRKRGRGEGRNGNVASGFMNGGGTGSLSPPLMSTQLSGEIMGVLGDGSKSAWDKKHWMMVKLLQVEEQGVKYQYEALEIEKQRLKWVRFSSKKEREMEKMKIDNERRRLENQRMLLLLKQKELEMLNQRPSTPSNPSPMSN